MKRIGLMGCGTVANYGHLPVLEASETLDIVALFDPDPGRLEAASKKFGISAAFTDVDEFLSSDIEAVTITSPAPFHLQNIRDVARHGKHILCEKPLAITEEECVEAIRAADDAGVMLFTAFDYRFSPVSMKIKELVENGAIGRVRSLRLVYIWNCHGKFSHSDNGKPVSNARRDGRMDEGGPLVDCGVHQIDLARWWLGSEATNWSAAAAWVDEYEAPDHVYLHMNHDSGAHTMVEISYSFCHTTAEPINHFTYQLIGERGIIHYNREQKLFEVRTDKGTEKLPFANEKNFEGLYDAFAEALTTGKPGDLPTGTDGLMATKISREATQSVIANRASTGNPSRK